jgi:hypothetical protein
MRGLHAKLVKQQNKYQIEESKILNVLSNMIQFFYNETNYKIAQ